MTQFTKYDRDTGAIITDGDLSDESLEVSIEHGMHAVLDVRLSSATHYIDVSGEQHAPREYSEAERAAIAGLQPGWAWQMPDRIAVDMRALDDLKLVLIAQVDAAADAARARVVGDAVRVKEYERAQAQAEAFQAAGFTGTVPSCVACWAAAKEWTPQAAAEDILAAAARWTAALDGIRALRLQAKEDIRRASDNAAVDARLATFIATLKAAMQGVQ